MADLEDAPKIIRVVIVEDNRFIREGWSTILDDNPLICVKNSFRNCEEAFESQDLQWSDVVLLDIQLPGMSGTDGVEKFLEINPKLAIIMATILEDSQHIFTALQNGAIGYMIKKVTPGELVQAVKDAYEGGSPMSPAIARKVIASLQTSQNRNREKLHLSEREQEVLQLLGQGQSYAAIAKEIHLSVNGVGYHIRNIYRKFQVNNKTEAVAKGISSGLIKIFDN